MEKLIKIIPYLIPVFIVQLGLIIFCLVDLNKRNVNTIRFNKLIWFCIILFINPLGPIIYLLFKEGEENNGTTH